MCSLSIRRADDGEREIVPDVGSGRSGEQVFVDVLKKSNAELSPNDAALVTSMTISFPAIAASRPLPVTVSTPRDKDVALTSWPARRTFAVSCVPTTPLAPATMIFISTPSLSLPNARGSTMTVKLETFHRA
jgi:hypothetical protein